MLISKILLSKTVLRVKVIPFHKAVKMPTKMLVIKAYSSKLL